MNPDQARQIIITTLRKIAPETDFEEVNPDINFRDQLDIDSMDFLNFVIGLHKATGINIPEVDYPKLFTLNGCVEYLHANQ